MKDYSNSMEWITEIRKGDDHHDPLTMLELRQYRRFTGKLSWLIQGTHPDLSYTTLAMLKKIDMVTITDLHNINRVIEKVEMKESQVCYGYVGRKDDLKVIGIGNRNWSDNLLL